MTEEFDKKVLWKIKYKNKNRNQMLWNTRAHTRQRKHHLLVLLRNTCPCQPEGARIARDLRCGSFQPPPTPTPALQLPPLRLGEEKDVSKSEQQIGEKRERTRCQGPTSQPTSKVTWGCVSWSGILETRESSMHSGLAKGPLCRICSQFKWVPDFRAPGGAMWPWAFPPKNCTELTAGKTHSKSSVSESSSRTLHHRRHPPKR